MSMLIINPWPLPPPSKTSPNMAMASDASSAQPASLKSGPSIAAPNSAVLSVVLLLRLDTDDGDGGDPGDHTSLGLASSHPSVDEVERGLVSLHFGCRCSR